MALIHKGPKKSKRLEGEKRIYVERVSDQGVYLV